MSKSDKYKSINRSADLCNFRWEGELLCVVFWRLLCWKFKFRWLFCYLISNFGIKILPIFEVSRLTSMHWGCPNVFLKTTHFLPQTQANMSRLVKKYVFFFMPQTRLEFVPRVAWNNQWFHTWNPLLNCGHWLGSLTTPPSKSVHRHIMWTWKDTFDGVSP